MEVLAENHLFKWQVLPKWGLFYIIIKQQVDKPLGRSGDILPENFEIERLWNAILHILLEMSPKKISFRKGQNIKGYKEIFQFLFCSASLIENIHHTLMPSLASVLTDLRKRQSRFSLIPSKLCFPLNLLLLTTSNTCSHIISQKVSGSEIEIASFFSGLTNT